MVINKPKVWEFKCCDSRYRLGNDPLKLGLRTIREIEGINESSLYSAGAWGGFHNLIQPDYKTYWEEQIKIAIEVVGITRISGPLHLDCRYAKELLAKRNIEYTLEAEIHFCRRVAIRVQDFLEPFMDKLTLAIYLQSHTDARDIRLFNDFEFVPIEL